jgi:hypothetical protein
MTCTDTFDPSALDDEQLTDELCRWSAQVAASTCRFVLLAAELDRRVESWSVYGVPTGAHWLNWRCGLSLSAAREHLRVGHALADLELVRGAFMAGEISYSKARALTRIATAKTEEWLLDMAGLMTAGALEQVCSSYRRVELEDERREQAQAARETRHVRNWTTATGQVAIYAELPADEAAVVIAALEARLRQLREERLTEVEELNQARHDVSAETPETNGEEGGDVSAETSPAWPTMADALVATAEAALAAGPAASTRSESTRVVLHIDQRVLDDPANEGCCHIESVGVVPVAMAERLLCDASVRTVRYTQDGIELSSPSRGVPERLQRALRLRDGGCRFPGCERRLHLHAHHVVWASRGGPTEMGNLVLLCSFHHHLVHEGGWELSMAATGDVTVRDPEGAEVHEVAPRTPRAADLLDTGVMPYGGEPFDMSDFIDALVQMEDPPAVA